MREEEAHHWRLCFSWEKNEMQPQKVPIVKKKSWCQLTKKTNNVHFGRDGELTRIADEANEFVIILSLKPLLHFMDTLRGSSGLVLANKII